MEGGSLSPPQLFGAPKKPSIYRVKITDVKYKFIYI